MRWSQTDNVIYIIIIMIGRFVYLSRGLEMYSKRLTAYILHIFRWYILGLFPSPYIKSFVFVILKIYHKAVDYLRGFETLKTV